MCMPNAHAGTFSCKKSTAESSRNVISMQTVEDAKGGLRECTPQMRMLH